MSPSSVLPLRGPAAVAVPRAVALAPTGVAATPAGEVPAGAALPCQGPTAVAATPPGEVPTAAAPPCQGPTRSGRRLRLPPATALGPLLGIPTSHGPAVLPRPSGHRIGRTAANTGTDPPDGRAGARDPGGSTGTRPWNGS